MLIGGKGRGGVGLALCFRPAWSLGLSHPGAVLFRCTHTRVAMELEVDTASLRPLGRWSESVGLRSLVDRLPGVRVHLCTC